jgi:hypothetical protein
MLPDCARAFPDHWQHSTASCSTSCRFVRVDFHSDHSGCFGKRLSSEEFKNDSLRYLSEAYPVVVLIARAENHQIP